MANKDYILTQISQTLDISPSDFKRAQKRFNAVKDWLIDGEYKSGFSPKIYLQGSFRLGTVVRPYKEDKDANFDIDQVCELSPKSHTEPSILKNDIGNRLKENSNYLRMLDEEGKRCWTLEYFSDDNSPGFHLDILPSLSARNGIEYQIDITHKETNKYSWSKSNPNGYYLWFKSKNIFSQEFMLEEKRKLYEGNKNIYNVLEDVPTQLLRSPLQRAIQIMKRHRDVFFSNKNNKPISIIITTITTHIRTSSSLIEVINEFVDYTLERYESWLKEGYLVCDGILYFEEGVWIVPNPVDQGLDKSKIENFADKWNSDDALPNAFFEWVRQLKRDINRFIKSGVSDDLNLRTKNIGDGDSYSELLKKEVQQDIESGLGSNQNLLQLIHLGIEGKVDWEFIKKVAQREYDIAENDDSKNVAKVNFYQVTRHRGISLSEEAVKDIITVLNYNKNSSRYVMCCNLLLGTATHEMVRKCITEYGYENILDWPIIRLYDFPSKNIFLPRKYS